MLHAADKRVFKEDRKPRVRGRAALDVLQFRSTPSNAESQPGNGRRRDGSSLGKVDVVDVLDAFEANLKRAAEPVFEVAQWAIGGPYYVRATLPDGTIDRVEGFAT